MTDVFDNKNELFTVCNRYELAYYVINGAKIERLEPCVKHYSAFCHLTSTGRDLNVLQSEYKDGAAQVNLANYMDTLHKVIQMAGEARKAKGIPALAGGEA